MANTQKTHPSVAFVSGAARGIGKAIALKLAGDGFNVAINDIQQNFSALEDTAKEIRAIGIKELSCRLFLLRQYQAGKPVWCQETFQNGMRFQRQSKSRSRNWGN